MAFKALFAIVAQALLIQAAFAQCRNSIIDNIVVINSASNGLAGGLALGSGLGLNAGLAGFGAAGLGCGNGWNNGLGLGAGLGLGNTIVGGPGFIDLSGVSAGGVLPTSSVSSFAPAGLSVVSDNVIEGSLWVNGQLPFLSAVALEGALATAGSGAASCGCGNGNIGILSESAPAAILPAVNGLGLGGLAGNNRFGCL